jgi:glycosyltransferase involved in cell wall biosynthesis
MSYLNQTVLHINHTTFGGPGRVVNTIYNALEKIGYDNIFVSVRGMSDKKMIYLNKYEYYFSRVLSKIYSKASTSKIKIEPEVFCFNKYEEIISQCASKKITIIILYWYKNTISIDDIETLVSRTGAKIYIYLMDESPLTGGCHYFENCERYMQGCGNCPSILWGKLDNDITFRNVKKEKYILEKLNTTIICPSTISLNDAKNSYKFRNLKLKKLLIPLNNDYDIRFSKSQYRTKLDLDLNCTYIFFGATSLDEDRKGMKYLIDSLQHLYTLLGKVEQQNIRLLIAGKSENFDFSKLQYKYVELGYLNHEDLLSAYHAADIFVSPSTIDMGPMMVNEAIKCGLPVVSFDIGISIDLVKNGFTGYRVETMNSIKMAESILNLLRKSKEERIQIRENCLNTGRKLLSEDKFYNDVKEIFEC